MAGDPRACEKRGFNTQEYKPATLERDAFGCPAGQFTHDGRCKTCPANTRRMHLAGLDNGRCKVDKASECMGDMRLAKRPPNNFIEKLGNLVAIRSEKVCAPRFDTKAFALAAVDDVGAPLLTAVKTLARRLSGNDAATKKKLDEALETLLSFEAFGLLVEAASEAHDFSISVGFARDGSVGVGTNAGVGFSLEIGEYNEVVTTVGG